MTRVFTALFAFCLAPPAAAQLDVSGQVVELVSQSVDLVYSTEELGGRVHVLAVTETETEIRIELAADVLFSFDSAEIQPGAAEALREAGGVIRQHATGEVSIEGHTDARGADTYNQALSERRAAAVRDWLVHREGLTGLAFATRGFGESRPVAPNSHPDASDNPDGRQRNRRVEIRLRK